MGRQKALLLLDAVIIPRHWSRMADLSTAVAAADRPAFPSPGKPALRRAFLPMVALLVPAGTVSADPLLTFSGPAPVLQWTAQGGREYQVQIKGSLHEAEWINTGPLLAPASDAPLSFTDLAARGAGQRFYRLVHGPAPLPPVTGIYGTGFEAHDEAGRIGPGELTGQGSPPWEGYYLSAYDTGGRVVGDQSFGGASSLFLEGYRTSRLQLAGKTTDEWLEFAFRPAFPDNDPQRVVWARTTRGEKADVVGIDFRLLNGADGTGKIMVNGTEVGIFVNHVWQTVSFRHARAESPPGSGAMVFSGAIEVFLNGSKVATVGAQGGHHYAWLQTLVFSSAEESWVHNGAWYIDGVHIGSSPLYVGRSTAYECGFEAHEQDGSFLSGPLRGQGAPAWGERYLSGHDAGGIVTTDRFHAGSRSLFLSGYSTSRVTLPDKITPEWLEFAFRPAFPDDDPRRVVWARTTRGPVDDVVGIDMRLDNGTGRITVNGADIGPFTNHAWHRISFRHARVESPSGPGGYHYTGRVEVYLDGKMKATVAAQLGYAYAWLQTLVFSSAEESWAHNGAWYIDDIHAGDSPRYLGGPAPRRPERHLLGWATDFTGDYYDKMDYFDRVLGLTDIWIACIEYAWPSTYHEIGFPALVQSGILPQFRQRGIRYWLEEHEAFCTMVRDEADLRDETQWAAVYADAARIYAQARQLGFRGLVLDAENYYPVSEAMTAKYGTPGGEPVTSWSFREEFGRDGQYYRRGLAYGNIIRQVWPECTMIQLYEALAFGGNREGNFWWLQGIRDAGVEIWIAAGMTYGAGANEIPEDRGLDWLGCWHVPDTAKYVAGLQAAYPMASRVLPGFHPWNAGTKRPLYLPRYLTEQLNRARNLPGFWLYTEGLHRGGDPRESANREDAFWSRHGVTPQDYLDCFAWDTTPPQGAIAIDGGAPVAASDNVIVSVAAADTNAAGHAESGVARMRFRNGNGPWSEWEAYRTSKNWNLGPGTGNRTVSAQFKDAQGNLSVPVTDEISR